MIWDCFMVRDELDMLKCRFLYFQEAGLPVVHVLIEAPFTHRGQPKVCAFAVHRERFRPWEKRILYRCTDFTPDPADPWRNEHQQRDAALGILADRADPQDIILISDVDEFPPLGILAYMDIDPAVLAAQYGAVAFKQRLMMYAVDWEYPEQHVCTVAARWDVVRQSSLSSVRDRRLSMPVIDGGFHLTWLGGVEAQKTKLGVHCHMEMTEAEAHIISSGAAYERGVHHSGGLMMNPVEVDETWPGYIYRRECPANWFRPR